MLAFRAGNRVVAENRQDATILSRQDFISVYTHIHRQRGAAGTQRRETMATINSLTDLQTWIANANPAGIYGAAREMIPEVARALADADGRPDWGQDWDQWLAEHAERIALEVVGGQEMMSVDG